MEEPQSPKPGPKIRICASGDRLQFILKSNRHHHPDRLYPGQPDSARPGIGGPIAFQSPSMHWKDTSKPRDIHMCERRWYMVGYSDGNSNIPKMISKEFTRVLCSKPSFHDIDCACLWKSVVHKVRERLPDSDPISTAAQWLEPLKLGSDRVRCETCRCKSDVDTHPE